jgi:hypothetical protein
MPLPLSSSRRRSCLSMCCVSLPACARFPPLSSHRRATQLLVSLMCVVPGVRVLLSPQGDAAAFQSDVFFNLHARTFLPVLLFAGRRSCCLTCATLTASSGPRSRSAPTASIPQRSRCGSRVAGEIKMRLAGRSALQFPAAVPHCAVCMCLGVAANEQYFGLTVPLASVSSSK